MKLNLSLIAVILSIIAIIVSLGQPTHNFLMSMNKTESGKPSFSMGRTDFYVHYTFTRINLRNNGTATAHDVRVTVIFFGSTLQNWEMTEFLYQLNASDSVMIEIPVGYLQLNSSVPSFFGEWFTNVTSYEADVHIRCRGLQSTTTFLFQNFIT